jgi:hypothetical protein
MIGTNTSCLSANFEGRLTLPRLEEDPVLFMNAGYECVFGVKLSWTLFDFKFMVELSSFRGHYCEQSLEPFLSAVQSCHCHNL